MNIKTKQCPQCGQTKDVSAFGRKGKYLRSWCKDCLREYNREYNRKWAEENPARRRANKFRSDSKDRGYPEHPDFDFEELVKLYEEAIDLEVKTGEKYSIDHILSRTNGGVTHHDNLQVMPLSLNNSKKDSLDWKHPDYKHWTELPDFLIPAQLDNLR